MENFVMVAVAYACTGALILGILGEIFVALVIVRFIFNFAVEMLRGVIDHLKGGK